MVGSGVDYLLESKEEQPADFDIIVEPSDFSNACSYLVGMDVKFNTFGGLKVTFPIELDIWPITLNDYVKKRVGLKALKFNPVILVTWGTP